MTEPRVTPENARALLKATRVLLKVFSATAFQSPGICFNVDALFSQITRRMDGVQMLREEDQDALLLCIKNLQAACNDVMGESEVDPKIISTNVLTARNPPCKVHPVAANNAAINQTNQKENSMSIEIMIAENTAALKELTATILATTKLAPGSSVASTTTAAEDKPAEKPAPKAADKAKAKAAPAEDDAEKPAPKAKAITREMMVAALTELKEAEGGGLPACKKIIAGEGESASMKEIEEGNIKAVYDAAKAKIKALAAGGDEDGM